MEKTATSAAERLRPYLPPPLIRAWHHDPGREPVWGERVDGSLMHCDVTGFTAMSERLAERGKEGAEVMVEVLNRFFSRMLGIADGWSGEQIKFGGDAMLLLFSGEQHAQMAAACALEMQDAMREFRAVKAGGEVHGLKMRIGIHSGSFFLASVGDRENLLHLLITGPDVNRAAEVEPAAAPGKVALSAEALRSLDGACRVSALRDGMFSIRGWRGPPPPRRPRVESPLSIELERYVHPVIRERTKETVAPDGEHRRVSVMFINVVGLSHLLAKGKDSLALEQADRYLRLVLDCLGSHGGFLLGTDASEIGDKVIALFGAPVSQTQPEVAALRCALDLNRRMLSAGVELRHRMGVNSGFVFAGEIGSVGRREYTVIGDAVNLAARLMTAARWGEIITSEETWRAAGEAFKVQRMRPLRVKGKSAPVRACRLIWSGDHEMPSGSEPESLVGRESELRQLQRLSVRSRRGRPSWAYVSGEAGIGKSSLLRALESRLASGGWRTLAGQCYAHTSHVPFGAWRSVLRSLFRVTSDESFEDFESKVEALVPGQASSAVLLAPVLSLASAHPDATQPADAESARRLIKETVVAALTSSAREQPILLVLEDAHWMDPASTDLLREVVARARWPLMVVVSSREETGALDIGRKAGATLDLEPLPPEFARRLASTVGGDLNEPEIDAVLARSGGNPLLLTAFARSVPGGSGALPETVEDAITSQIDLLPTLQKAAVRAASVVGQTFDTDMLKGLLPATAEDSLHDSLEEIVAAGLARREGSSYTFAHSVVRDIVHEMLPYSQRRRMHGQMVQHLEAARSGRLETVCEDLLYHAALAENAPRVVRYACLSGDRAARMYMSEAAILHFDRALATLEKTGGRIDGDRSVLLEKSADALEVMGRHGDAATQYEESLNVRQTVGTPKVRYILGGHSDAARPAKLCRKVGVSLERAARFEESLNWLDKALALLPPRRPRLGAQICAARSVSLFRFGRYEEGVTWGRRALRMAQRSRDRRESAYSHNMLANSYMESGELMKAVGHLRRAVRIYHEIGDFAGQASANNNLGMCYHLQGTLDAALYYYQVALQTDHRVGDAVDAMIVRCNIGEVLITLGRLPEAIDDLGQVVAAEASDGGLTGVAGLAHVNLSRCYLAIGDHESSRRHLRLGKRLLKRAEQAGLLAEAELQRAELLLAEGRVKPAVAAARGWLKSARVLGARLLEARGQRLLGEALAAQGRTSEGQLQIRESISLARRLSAKHDEARSLTAQSRLLLRSRRNPQRAKASLRRAEKILERIGDQVQLREVRRLRGGDEG